MVEKWAVIQTEMYPEDGATGMWGAFTILDSKEKAEAFIHQVLRDEWTTEISMPSDEDPDRVELLAYHKGYQSCESVKYSDVYYSEDGLLAWADMGTRAYKIEAVALKENGERTCMTC